MRAAAGEVGFGFALTPCTPYADGFFRKKCSIFWRISLRSLLHGTVKLVCYVGPVAAVGAALGERGPETHETRSYH